MAHLVSLDTLVVELSVSKRTLLRMVQDKRLKVVTINGKYFAPRPDGGFVRKKEVRSTST